MAAVSSSNYTNAFVRRYNRELMAQFERHKAPFYDQIQEGKDGGSPSGQGRYWGITYQNSHAAAAVAAGADLPAFVQPGVLQGVVTARSLAVSAAWTDEVLSLGRAEDSISNVDVVSDIVARSLDDAMVALNRQALGHGTGRMAVVEANTSSATSFVVRNPESWYQLRVGMSVGFYDTDSGGSLQGNIQTITDINPDTRTVTIDAARSLTAGWGLYKAAAATGGTGATEYGITAMGLRGTNDNGTLAATIYGLTRSSNPNVLNAQVLTSSTTAGQTYSEALVRKGINRVRLFNNGEVDQFWCNLGVLSEHFNSLSGNRMFTVGPEESVPGYDIGNKRDPFFYAGARKIPFKIDEDLPNRELHGIVTKLWRKHIGRKLNWVGDGTDAEGNPSPILMQLPGTGTYALSKVAALYWLGAISHKLPAAGVCFREIADGELAGD